MKWLFNITLTHNRQQKAKNWEMSWEAGDVTCQQLSPVSGAKPSDIIITKSGQPGHVKVILSNQYIIYNRHYKKSISHVHISIPWLCAVHLLYFYIIYHMLWQSSLEAVGSPWEQYVINTLLAHLCLPLSLSHWNASKIYIQCFFMIHCRHKIQWKLHDLAFI